jgi:hypothetical protein
MRRNALVALCGLALVAVGVLTGAFVWTKRLSDLPSPHAADRGSEAVDPRDADLWPNDGLFDGAWQPEPYELAVRAALLSDHQYRTCQVVALPTGPYEWAVYIVRGDGNRPTIVYKHFRSLLWGRMMDRLSGRGTQPSYSVGAEAQAAALRQIKFDVETSSAEVSAELAELLESVWAGMLGRVRYAESSRAGTDGTNYYVSTWSPRFGVRSGTTWSPGAGSQPAVLVALAEQMATLTQSSSESARSSAEASLADSARALLRRLK